MDLRFLQPATKGMTYTRYGTTFRQYSIFLLTLEMYRLGDSGLKVSKVILGAMSFGSADKWTVPMEQALPIIKHAFDKGINTWDTVRQLFPLYNVC